MKLTRSHLTVYAITPPHEPTDSTLLNQVEAAIRGGATMIQLRRKEIPLSQVKEEALQVQALCRQYKVPFIIDDNVALAKEIQADGVHIGQDDMPLREARSILGDNAIIGITAKTIAQAELAYEEGADYIGSGAVFATDTKKDTTRMSHDIFESICRAVPIPVVAIGGITKDNMSLLDGRGMAGFAMIGAIFNSSSTIDEVYTKTRQVAMIAHRLVDTVTALTIAGSDCSGGAGIQADLKTMLAHHVYGMSAITSLTAQNTMGVSAISNVTTDFMAAQLDAIFTDIPPKAIKTGMLSNKELITVIAEKLQHYKATNIVVDPVMIATSGARLIDEDAIETLVNTLLPLATLVTPNIPEAETLSRISITSGDDMLQAASTIHSTYHCAVLVKGGHRINDANDLLYISPNDYTWFTGKRIKNNNTHGTGCTLSSAIASNLAKGYDIPSAVQRAKDYISLTLSAMMDIGHGSGPMDHGAGLIHTQPYTNQ